MDAKLKIDKVEQNTGSVQLTLCGNVNLTTSSKLFAVLRSLFSTSVQSVVIDLSKVAVMDSSGIATLVEGLHWARQSGGSFVLTGMTDQVRDAFGLAKLEQEFTIV